MTGHGGAAVNRKKATAVYLHQVDATSVIFSKKDYPLHL